VTERTLELYHDDAYLRNCQAEVIEVNERGGIVLEKTVFYATGGGQPGDIGSIDSANASTAIGTTIRVDGDIVHVPLKNQPNPTPGSEVTASIDWENRYLMMRMHTATHLLCSLVPCGVTGGSVGPAKSRIDFDLADHVLDKQHLNEEINRLIDEDHRVETVWVSREEFHSRPQLARTMTVKPPADAQRIRLVKIGDDVDLQSCGGTHVVRTGEIGRLRVGKIENKGARNRRVNIHLEG
jgi:misacylated tRNA(Ala) deacylase